MNILEKLFGSNAKGKLLKLFIFNPEIIFDTKQISKKVQIREKSLRKDINILLSIKLIRKKDTKDESGRKRKGFVLNSTFQYLEPLREFLMKVSPISNEEISEKLSRAGRLKFAVVSGVFINNPESRVDMLIVGDRLKKPVLARALSSIESDLGKELQYAVFDTSDFEYRRSLGDKLIRDILEYPHQIIFDRLGIGEY